MEVMDHLFVVRNNLHQTFPPHESQRCLRVSTRDVNRQVSESVRIQYGGSVNDKNAAELGVLDFANGMF